MPPAKKAASRRSATARKRPAARKKRPAAKQPASINRLNKSLDAAQDALASLGKDVSKDLGAGGRDLYKNLQRFVKNARRDSGKLPCQRHRRLRGIAPRGERQRLHLIGLVAEQM